MIMATASSPTAAIPIAKKIPAVLKHFATPSSIPQTDFKAKCNYCLKEITGSTKSTTNWWKHLRRAHPLILKQQEYETQTTEKQQVLSHFMAPSKKYDAKHPRQILLSISSDIFKKLSEIDGSPPKLTLHDKNLLNDIVEILAPFEEATDFVQVGCIPSAGYVLPCIKGLQHHLQSMVTKYHSPFVLGLTKSLSSRMPYFEEKEAYILAAILDPRFKLRWCSDDTQKQTYVELVKSEVEMISTSSEPSSATLQLREEPPPKRKKSLFSFMPDSPSQVELNNGNVSSEEMYFETPCVSMDTNPLTFWKENAKKYPLLSRLARDYLAIPSSSSPVERLFSIAGKIFRPERCQLSDDRFQQLMFIRCNNAHT